MWDLPGPGLEPMSPALAGGFLTTAPPGKPSSRLLDLVTLCLPLSSQICDKYCENAREGSFCFLWQFTAVSSCKGPGAPWCWHVSLELQKQWSTQLLEETIPLPVTQAETDFWEVGIDHDRSSLPR